MTPTDELWIDMAQFDTEIADGLWDGQLPADAPAWCADVSSLIGAARGPATDDELAAEDMIVSRMAEAILAAAAGVAPSDEDLYLDFPPLDTSLDEDLLDDELEFVFVTADAPASGEVKAVDPEAEAPAAPEADESQAPDTQIEIAAGADADADTEEPADRTKVNGTKVNGTKPTLTVVTAAPAEDAEVDAPAEDVAAASSAGDATAEAPAAGDATAEEPATGDGVEEAAAAVAPRPLVGGDRRRAGKRSGGPRHFAPKGDEGPGRLRLVRRVVAVKAVATTTAVAIGITAAAAATGVVVTVVDPPKWPGSSDEEAQSTTLLPPAMTIDIGDAAGDGRPGRVPRSSPVKQLTCVLDFGCPDPVAVVGTETAAVLAELKEADPSEFERRVVTSTTGPRPTSTASDPVPLGSTASDPATSTTLPPPETTTTPPPPETTTTTPPPETTTTTTPPEETTTTSTTSTTIDGGPSTLAAPTEG